MKNLTDNENKFNELWDLIIDQNIATEDELKLISSINGQNIETLNDVLYVRTGYRDLEQFEEYEDYEEELWIKLLHRILTDQYDAGRIYQVVNPYDCQLSSGSGTLLCDDEEESPLSDACVCGLSVIVSRAKTIPSTWKHVQPGIQDTDARWDKAHEVFVRIFDDDNE